MAEGIAPDASVAANAAPRPTAQTINRIESPIVLRCTPGLVGERFFLLFIYRALPLEFTWEFDGDA
jgi:hypothetical protein